MSTVPDIFLSYNREDQAVARRFAEAFEREGLSVWWDQTLRSGEAYDKVTEQALRTAMAVVVLWSKKSVDSRWVRAEATLADRQHTLVPAMIEPCDRPIMFELTQTADLAHWDGSPTDKAWLAFLADVKQFVEASGSAGRSDPPSHAPSLAQAAAASRPDRLSICVLPFANMSGDPEQEYFSDGISEDIITDLSKVSALFVIARNSAFAFKGKHVDIKQVARQLNVAHVLEGSVRKAGSRVRITAQLIDGATGGHLWAERWDRDLDDIFALQDEISEAIVQALKLKLLPEEKKAIEGRGTANVEAYDLFLRAQAQARHGGAQSNQRAMALYREATELDPRFHAAWAELARSCATLSIFLPQSRDEWGRLRDHALERAKATATDPRRIDLLEAIELLVPSDRDWIGAGKAIERATERDPSRLQEGLSVDLLMILVTFFANVGRVAEAIDWSRAAKRMDSLDSAGYLQFLLDCAGRREEADSEYRRSMALPVDAAWPEYVALRRAMAYEGSEGVKERFRRYLGLNPGDMPIHVEVLARFDDRAAVLDLIRKASKEPLYQDPYHALGLADLAAFYRDDECTLACLRAGLLNQPGTNIGTIWHPQFASLRKTQAFKQLVRDLGLYEYWRSTDHWGDYARPLGETDFEVFR